MTDEELGRMIGWLEESGRLLGPIGLALYRNRENPELREAYDSYHGAVTAMGKTLNALRFERRARE